MSLLGIIPNSSFIDVTKMIVCKRKPHEEIHTKTAGPLCETAKSPTAKVPELSDSGESLLRKQQLVRLI